MQPQLGRRSPHLGRFPPDQRAGTSTATKTAASLPGAAGSRSATVNQPPKSVVREIRTPRSVGTGGGRPPPVTRWASSNGRPYRNPSFLATCGNQASVLYCTHMNTTTFSVRVGRSTKSRLEKLAKSTGRSRAFLAAEAISAYLDTNEWQISGIARALASLDRGKGIAHARVSEWVASWETRKERRSPRGV